MFLSHQQTIGTTQTACIRFAVLSRVEIPHVLLEHCYDSQRNQNTGLSWPTSSATASHEKPGSAQSAPTVPMAACRRRIGCTPRREGSGRLPDQWHEARAIIDYELISSSPGATYQVDFEVRGVPHVAVNVSQLMIMSCLHGSTNLSGV